MKNTARSKSIWRTMWTKAFNCKPRGRAQSTNMSICHLFTCFYIFTQYSLVFVWYLNIHDIFAIFVRLHLKFGAFICPYLLHLWGIHSICGIYFMTSKYSRKYICKCVAYLRAFASHLNRKYNIQIWNLPLVANTSKRRQGVIQNDRPDWS